MPFDSFDNLFQDPASVPSLYLEHSNLQRLFQSNGSYVRSTKDPVILWAIDILNREYGVPLDVIDVDVQANAAEGENQEEKQYQAIADVVIYDDRFINTNGKLDVALIILEAIEPGEKIGDREPGEWVEHYKRLNAYMNTSPSARYAILTNGINTTFYRRGIEYSQELEKIGDLPKYQSVREAAKYNPYIVILNPSEPDGVETGLKPLTREQFRKVLSDKHSGCLSILHDNEGLQTQEAVKAMVKFLFAKWYDEQATIDLAKQRGETTSYVFSVGTQTDSERLVVQIRETFRQAKEWEKKLLRTKFQNDLNFRSTYTEKDELAYQPHTTRLIVEKLQPWSLHRSPADVKGGVFEDFLSETFRDDLGQYFTPTPVINLMVGILQPNVNDFIGDPACGSARMITHALDYVRKKEFDQRVKENDGSTNEINPDEPSKEFAQFRDNHLFGAEISRPIMQIARINMLMNDAQYTDLRVMDCLTPLESITDGIMHGLPANSGFYPNGLTMILTNPPFGSKVIDPLVLQDFASRDGVTRRKGSSVSSVPQEVAFINRCLELLAPNGRLAIVLPDGVLANNSMQYVRDWILRWAKLKAVISLPQTTFTPFGAGIKTSVVFLEKREKPLKSMSQPELFEEMSEADEDYDIYMARIDEIGYDVIGRLTVSEESADQPPEVKKTIESFTRRLGWKANGRSNR